MATFVASEEEPENIPYSAVYVKRDGAWLLDRVTEENLPVAAELMEKTR